MIPLGALVEVFLEETSDRNLVRWFAEEIAQGDMKNISHGGRRQLKKNGLLKRGRGKLQLTPYGERILEDVKKNE